MASIDPWWAKAIAALAALLIVAVLFLAALIRADIDPYGLPEPADDEGGEA